MYVRTSKCFGRQRDRDPGSVSGGSHTCRSSPASSCSGLFSLGAAYLRVWLSSSIKPVKDSCRLNVCERPWYSEYPAELCCLCATRSHEGSAFIFTEGSHGLELGFGSCCYSLSWTFALCGDARRNRHGSAETLYVVVFFHIL